MLFWTRPRLAQRRARPNPLGRPKKTKSTQIGSNKAFNMCSSVETHHHPNLSVILDKRGGLTQDDEH
jgi:hypothetical protein